MSPPNHTSPPPAAPPPASMGHKVLVSYGLFTVFFLFYVGAALMQTPAGKEVGMMKVAGMPLGLLMSLAIFPVSWLLIVVWFWKAR